MKLPNPLLITASALLVFSLGKGFDQTGGEPTTNHRAIELRPFVVTSDQQQGDQAGNTLTNTLNVERIEEARGPNSIRSGIASAGGLIRTSAKQALSHRSHRRAQRVYGSYDPLSNRVSNAHAAVLEINRLIAQGPRYWRFSANFTF